MLLRLNVVECFINHGKGRPNSCFFTCYLSEDIYSEKIKNQYLSLCLSFLATLRRPRHQSGRLLTP